MHYLIKTAVFSAVGKKIKINRRNVCKHFRKHFYHKNQLCNNWDFNSHVTQNQIGWGLRAQQLLMPHWRRGFRSLTDWHILWNLSGLTDERMLLSEKSTPQVRTSSQRRWNNARRYFVYESPHTNISAAERIPMTHSILEANNV